MTRFPTLRQAPTVARERIRGNVDTLIDDFFSDYLSFDEGLTDDSLRAAALRNEELSMQLGWHTYLDDIVKLLASSGWLDPITTPQWEDITQAVFYWQASQRPALKADGIIGPKTWARMRNILAIRVPAPKSTPTPAGPATLPKQIIQPNLIGPGWVQWIPSPYTGSRGNKVITSIVLHYTTGPSLENTVNYFKNNEKQVSAHYVLGKDGRVVQMVPLDRLANHASGINESSVGIEMVNYGPLWRRGELLPKEEKTNGEPPRKVCQFSLCSSKGRAYTGPTPIQASKQYWKNQYWEPYTEQQYESLGRLLLFITQQIPSINEITGHKGISKTGKKDPGPAFDWSRIRAALGPGFTGRIGFR